MANDRSKVPGAVDPADDPKDHAATTPIDRSKDDEATTPAEDAFASRFAELKVVEGTRVGRYLLGAKLGEGGMGTVFVADQIEPVRRRVAFKVIQLGMDTEALLRRFEAERQILALLEHPNVATMLDAGATPEGRPYFVMEFVDGIEIDDFCAKKRLTIHQRIELFLQVLAGVEHAHQKGIIHRDLKPGNIVISQKENQPVAKIIDFGIAKSMGSNITTDGLLTKLGEAIGTPKYMSPEQAEFSSDNLDLRTDIFSLGVILYELLVGVSPFERQTPGDDYREVVANRESRTPVQGLKQASGFIDRLASERQVSPRALRNALTADIAAVILKALKSERSERYRSVSEFADDLKRYLEGYPVIAQPRRFWYLAARFAARRKALLASASVITVALIGTTIAAVLGFIQAERAAELAEKSAAEANLIAEFQAAQLSEIDVQAMGLGLRTRMIEKIRAEQELRGLESKNIDSSIEQLQRLIEDANFTDLALEMLDRNIFDRAMMVIDKDFEEQPLIQTRLWQTIADSLVELGRYESAAIPQGRALETRRRVLGNEHPDTLDSINRTALLLHSQGKTGEAEPLAQEALESRRRVLGDEHPDTLASINSTALLLYYQGKSEEAEGLVREALESRRRVLGDEHADTLESINLMALVLQAQGKLAEAEPYSREVVDTLRRVFGEEHPDTLSAIGNMAYLLDSQGKYVEAEPYYREAMEGQRRVLGNEHQRTLTSISNMGFLLTSMGRQDEAERYHREALETRRRVLGDEHPDTLDSIHNMGHFLRTFGDLKEAETLGREVTDAARRVYGDQHPYLGVYLAAYGQTLAVAERFELANETLDDSHAILSQPGSGGEFYVERPVKALIELFDAWHEKMPGQGYNDKATEWRSRLAELGGEEGG